MWIRVADEADLTDRMSVDVSGHLVALFRLDDGVYAVDDVCSHEYSRLSEGDVWGEEVLCPKHGSRFRIRTGEVIGLPATTPVKSYAVKTEDGGIWLSWNQ